MGNHKTQPWSHARITVNWASCCANSFFWFALITSHRLPIPNFSCSNAHCRRGMEMRIIEFCLVLILTKMDPEKEQHSLLKGTSHDLGANQAMTIFKNLQRQVRKNISVSFFKEYLTWFLKDVVKLTTFQDYPSRVICDFNTKGPTTEVNLRLRDVFERQNRFNIDLTR